MHPKGVYGVYHIIVDDRMAHSKEGIYEKFDFLGDDANIPRASWEMNDINQINLE